MRLPGVFFHEIVYTVNTEMFAHYIFSRIFLRALDAQKFGANENNYHNYIELTGMCEEN